MHFILEKRKEAKSAAMKLIIPVLDYPFSYPFWKLNNPDNTVFKNFSKEKWDFFFYPDMQYFDH